MSMKRVPIAQASQKQLLHFARNVLQLDIPRDNATPNEIRAKMKAAAYNEDFIEYEAEGVDEPKRISDAKPLEGEIITPNGKPEKVKLQIHVQDTPAGDQPVFASVNGKAMFIPRGEVVEVPYAFYEALNNAKQYRYGSNTQEGLSQPIEVHTYPHSVHSPV